MRTTRVFKLVLVLFLLLALQTVESGRGDIRLLSLLNADRAAYAQASSSMFVTDTVRSIAAPTVPMTLTAQAISGTRIDLSWTAATDDVGVAGYKLYRRLMGEEDYTLAATTSQIQYSDTGVLENRIYEYVVSAFDAENDESEMSQMITIWCWPGAKTVWAEGLSAGEIQSAINAATDGDTVVLPEGTATWTADVELGRQLSWDFPPTFESKHLTIQGAGIDKTIISVLNFGMKVITVEGKPFRLTGITFQGPYAESSEALGIGGTSKNVRVDHCKFYNIGSSVALRTVYGVVDHCVFIETGAHFNSAFSSFGTFGGDDGSYAWSQPLSLGTALATYYEDCTIHFHTAYGNGGGDHYGGARYVYRYNTVINADSGHHGYDSGGYRSVFSWEVYENTFTWLGNIPQAVHAVSSRGGTGVVFNNTIENPHTSGSNSYASAINLMSYRSKNKPQRIGYLNSPICDGSNPVDGNSAIESGIMTGSTSPLTLVSDGKNWTPDEWKGYFAWNLSDNNSLALVTGNTQDTITAPLFHLKDNGLTYNEIASSEVAICLDANWTPDQWVGYTIINQKDYSQGVITSNSSNAVTATLGGGIRNTWEKGDLYKIVSFVPEDGSDLRWEPGDHFKLANGYPCLDQNGMTNLTPGVAFQPQKSEPIYEWNNKFDGEHVDITHNEAFAPECYNHVKEGRDYFNETPKPGYVPYPYPHPLTVQDGIGRLLNLQQDTLLAQVNLRWDPVVGAVEYRITRDWQQPGVVVSATTWSEPLSSGERVYMVYALDQAGKILAAEGQRVTPLDLVLHGVPADQAIHLTWEVSATLPSTSTWRIVHVNQLDPAPVTVGDIVSTTRAYELEDLTNDVWYTVTLNAMLDATPILTGTVSVKPGDPSAVIFLPLVSRGRMSGPGKIALVVVGLVACLAVLAGTGQIAAFSGPSGGNVSAAGQDTSAQAALPAGGDIVTAASCELAAVQAAVDAAQDGDMVRVPAGTCTWSAQLLIHKGISLIGAGTEHTTIVGDTPTDAEYVYLIAYQPRDWDGNWPFRFSGFTLDMAEKRGGIYLHYRPGNTHFTIQTKIRIDHNVFKNTRSTPTRLQAITINGYRGLVDHNLFVATAYPIRFASGDSENWWNHWEGIVFGKADNNFYLEDNVFYNYEILSDSQFGNRYLFRYNTIVTAKADGCYPLLDMHGNAGQYWSTFGGEIYGNDITMTNGQILDQRGGKTLVFYNKVNGDSLGIKVREEVSDDENPSINPQPQHVSDSYNWNNRVDPTGRLLTAYEQYDCCDAISENSEFYNPDESFDGTSGVGCGLPAERPATCTPGVAYWATHQSCARVDGAHVGANPVEPISGTLYKCSAPDTWTAYYTPYTYPHPLTQDVLLSATPLDGAARLDWDVVTAFAFPFSTTWQIEYVTGSSLPVFVARDLVSTTNTYLLPNLTNGISYTVTLNGRVTLPGSGDTRIFTSQVSVKPRDPSAVTFLPFVAKGGLSGPGKIALVVAGVAACMAVFALRRV